MIKFKTGSEVKNILYACMLNQCSRTETVSVRYLSILFSGTLVKLSLIAAYKLSSLRRTVIQTVYDALEGDITSSLSTVAKLPTDCINVFWTTLGFTCNFDYTQRP